MTTAQLQEVKKSQIGLCHSIRYVTARPSLTFKMACLEHFYESKLNHLSWKKENQGSQPFLSICTVIHTDCCLTHESTSQVAQSFTTHLSPILVFSLHKALEDKIKVHVAPMSKIGRFFKTKCSTQCCSCILCLMTVPSTVAQRKL